MPVPGAMHVLQASWRPGHRHLQARAHTAGAGSSQQQQSVHATAVRQQY